MVRLDTVEIPRIERALADARTSLPDLIAAERLPVVSVILDGSWVRGDFQPGVSDLDLTVTLADHPASLSKVVSALTRYFADHSAKFPKRSPGRKPLAWDIQWQSLAEVDAAGQRTLSEWSADDVPAGYPKLWLYAFDSRLHHTVLYGEDVIERYTRLPPRAFVPIRLERLRRSVEALGGNVSDYDRAHGTITQMKNAWETMRLVHLGLGGASIAKDDVAAGWMRAIRDESLLDGGNKIASYYRDPSHYPDNIDVTAFRCFLYSFAQSALQRFPEERRVP